MTKEIDARGMSCPRPVLLAKQALADAADNGLRVLVDNPDAAENLKGLGTSLGYAVQAAPYEEKDFIVTFSKGKPIETVVKESPVANDTYLVVLQGDEMGQGDAAFGKKLLEGFIYALTEQDELPTYVVCYNKGVTLTTLNDKTVADLNTLMDKGIQVLSCGLCLDYYGLKEKLRVGQVTNMYRICELMRSHPVVKP